MSRAAAVKAHKSEWIASKVAEATTVEQVEGIRRFGRQPGLRGEADRLCDERIRAIVRAENALADAADAVTE